MVLLTVMLLMLAMLLVLLRLLVRVRTAWVQWESSFAALL
jgi:hypothetical protein